MWRTKKVTLARDAEISPVSIRLFVLENQAGVEETVAKVDRALAVALTDLMVCKCDLPA